MWVSGPAEKEWYPDGRMHFRGVPHEGFLTGDLTGDLFFMGNNNLDAATVDGVGWGILTFVGTGADSGKSFEGIEHFKISSFWVSGKFTCHGSGLFEGMLIKGSMDGPLGGPYTFQGYILSH
jgi:hypothetical protein